MCGSYVKWQTIILCSGRTKVERLGTGSRCELIITLALRRDELKMQLLGLLYECD